MDCAIKLLFALKNENKGNVGMLFGLLILPMFATVGMAIDYAQAITAHQKLQTLVDKAAIAGARLPATSNSNRIKAATDFFTDNLAHSGLTGVGSKIEGNNAEVAVSATYNHPTAIMKLFGHNGFNLKALARARAQVDNGGVACLLALSESASDGLHLQGINKTSSENCWAWVNSDSPTSINASGTAQGTAQGFCTHGGIVGADHFAPRPYDECDRLEDPFREKFMSYNPPSGDCTFTDLELKSGDHTLRPGVYCGDTVLKPQAHVTMQEGIYVFRNGSLEVQGQSSLTGHGVTLFFRGYDNGRLHVRSTCDEAGLPQLMPKIKSGPQLLQ